MVLLHANVGAHSCACGLITSTWILDELPYIWRCTNGPYVGVLHHPSVSVPGHLGVCSPAHHVALKRMGDGCESKACTCCTGGSIALVRELMSKDTSVPDGGLIISAKHSTVCMISRALQRVHSDPDADEAGITANLL